MSRDCRESDWKAFKELRALALERYCQKACQQAVAIASATEGSAHERYVRLYRHIAETDKMIQRGFDDLRRSTATAKILVIHSLKVWSPEELKRFSPEIQDLVHALSKGNRGD
ncbi:MAG: hypothetical protein RJA22_473 [Verrucomicrobiota bacterium]|jgi:hypothetical protein